MATQTLTVSADGSGTGWADEGFDYTRLQTDDGDTTRLYTPTSGSLRLLNFTDTSGLSGATINSVTISAKLKALDPVAARFQFCVKSNSMNYFSPDTGTKTWEKFEAGGASVTEQNNRLEIAYPSSSTSATDGDIVTPIYNFTGSSAQLQTIAVPSNSTSANAEMRVYTDANNWFRIVKEGPTLFFQRKKAGTNGTVASVTHSLTTHAYWKISESSGVVTWWTSSDGISWTSRGNYTHGMTITAMRILIAGTCYQNESNPGQFIVDNLNAPVANYRTYSSAPPLMEALSDNFNDNSLDSSAPTTYVLYTWVLPVDPATGIAWTTSALDSIQAGLLKTNSAGMGWSYIKIDIDYSSSLSTQGLMMMF